MKIEAQKKQQKPKYPTLAKTIAVATATAAALSASSCLQQTAGQQPSDASLPYEGQIYGGVK